MPIVLKLISGSVQFSVTDTSANRRKELSNNAIQVHKDLISFTAPVFMNVIAITKILTEVVQIFPIFVFSWKSELFSSVNNTVG